MFGIKNFTTDWSPTRARASAKNSATDSMDRTVWSSKPFSSMYVGTGTVGIVVVEVDETAEVDDGDG